MPDDDLALWRFSLVAPLLHRAANVSLTQMARQLAAEVKLAPDGAPVTVSTESLLRWLRRYQTGGLEALANRPRRDRGRCRALNEDTVARLVELADAHPDWTVKALHRQLQRDQGRALPLKPVYRLLKGRPRAKPIDARRHRPPGVPQVLWLADTMHGPAIYGPGRKKHTTFLLVVFDNGPNYRARVLRTACAQLGIHLVHASAYRPTSKARLERFFLTVRLQMLPRLPAAPTLQQVHTEWARFLGEYHETPHASLSQLMGAPVTPLAYYLRCLPADVRYPPQLDLADLFLLEATRRVNADATVRVAAAYWEVDPRLVGQRVLVRFHADASNSLLPQRVLYRPVEDPHAAFQQAFPVD